MFYCGFGMGNKHASKITFPIAWTEIRRNTSFIELLPFHHVSFRYSGTCILVPRQLPAFRVGLYCLYCAVILLLLCCCPAVAICLASTFILRGSRIFRAFARSAVLFYNFLLFHFLVL